MTTTPQSMSDLPELPRHAHAFQDPEGEQPDILVYTADQLREYGRLCRATAEQAGKVEVSCNDPMCDQVLEERDRHEEVIGQILDIVLGGDRHEWSSAYDFADAVLDVSDHMAALAKPTQPAATKQPVAWDESRGFDVWWRENVAPGTIISSPDWWAVRIRRQFNAERARESAPEALAVSESMVEEAAIALCIVDDCTRRGWHEFPEYGRDRYRDKARAALTAALAPVQEKAP